MDCAEALKLYHNLHARIDDMEERVKNSLWELSIPDLAKFTTKLKQVQAEIDEFNRKPILGTLI